jgi:cardiolipin synthase (CMP-forming)
MITSLPNLLTLSRIVAIPLLVALLYLPGDIWRWAACVVYAVACITDYFDGHLARSLSQTSALGRFLDPIADKLLVAAAIVVMTGLGYISGWTVLAGVVILCREILVSGLREFLAELRVGVPVSMLAKWKTTVQMVALGFLILGDAGPAALPIRLIGEIGFWVAAILTLVTGYDYLVTGLRHMQSEGQGSR